MNHRFSLFIILALVASTPCFAQTTPPYTLWGNSTGTGAPEAALPLPAINVLSFGADPTGAADSTMAIQAAINTAYNNVDGVPGVPNVVYLPPGKYKISSPLEIRPSGSVILQGAGVGTVISPYHSRAIDIIGSNRNETGVFLRDFRINGINASESTFGLIYINSIFNAGIEDIAIYCTSNQVANGIYIAGSGGIKVKDVSVYGWDTCGGTNSDVNTGINVNNNSQVSLDNVDVEGFNGTNGKGIATGGALVYLDIISSHVEANFYGYYHGASYGQTTYGRTNIYGGTFSYGAGPAAIEVVSDNLAVHGAGLFYGGSAFDIPPPASGGAFKNIVVDTQPPTTGKLFTSTSDLSGVHLRNQKVAVGGAGVLAINRLDFSKQFGTSGAPVTLFSIYNFSPGTFRLVLTSDGGSPTARTAAAYQVDFTVVNGSQSSPLIVTALGKVSGSYTTSATFNVAPTGSNGVILSVTPTASGGSSPTVSGYLEYYGVDYNGTQSVVASYCNPTGTGC
jgi:hypothetical protein